MSDSKGPQQDVGKISLGNDRETLYKFSILLGVLKMLPPDAKLEMLKNLAGAGNITPEQAEQVIQEMHDNLAKRIPPEK